MNRVDFKFKDIVIPKGGLLRGPFGGDLKKEIFVKKDFNTYKVYEQGVVLNSDKNIGRYYITENDYLTKLKKFSVEDKDFLVSCSGAYMGAIYQLKAPFEKGIINQALLRIRLNNEVIDDNYFLYLFKELICRKITSGSGDSTIPNFPGLDVIRNVEFSLPSKNIQVIIGRLLSSLDSQIELNNRINAELEAMAKTLYDYWFVQFDFPDANGKPYKSSGGAMVWNEELKREIPEGWEVKKIGEVATIKAGGDKPEVFSLVQNEYCTIPIYSNGITNYGLYGFTNTATTKKQSITISARGTIGYSVLRNKPFVPIIRLIVVTPNLDGVAKYFHEYIRGIGFENSGSVQQQLTVPQVSSLNILYPTLDVLTSFGNFTNPLVEKIETINLENQKLSELRDWLLPMLMNGQVKVK